MLQFSINQCALWDLSDFIDSETHQEVFYGKPKLKDVPPMVKRRMPILAQVIQELNNSQGQNSIPCVYASKNGELSRTIKIIRQYGSDLSPALFSMSVHNAIPGLLSVINKDNSPYTVIDSMSGVVEMAVFEAISQLEEHNAVKVIYFEEPTTKMLSSNITDTDLGMVLMLVLERGNEFSLQKTHCDDGNYESNSSNANIQQLFSLFRGNSNEIECRYSKTHWTWKKIEQH